MFSIFHHVSACLLNPADGVLIFSSDSTEPKFIWREYPKRNGNPQTLTIEVKKIQSILINYRKEENSVLITTKDPDMKEFKFDENNLFNLLTLLQTFAICQQRTDQDILTVADYVATTFSKREASYGIYNISFDETGAQFPPEFEFSQSLQRQKSTESAAALIITQYNINSESYTNNPLKAEEIRSMKSLEELRDAVMNRGLVPELRAEVWPVLFKILPFNVEDRARVLSSREKEYLSFKNQWQAMSKTQIKYSSQNREAFTTIRVDVKRTHPTERLSKIKNWQDILTSILKSFVMWNQNVRYTQGLNDLATNFMEIFIPSDLYTLDQAEAISFWCFAAFGEYIRSGLIAEDMMGVQTMELNQVKAVVERFQPPCVTWLESNQLDDLSFIIPSFILAYGRTFEQDAIARIWEAIVCLDSPSHFLICFTASLIILSFPSFASLPNCSTGTLVSMMDSIFARQDPGTLIGCSIVMMDNFKFSDADEPIQEQESYSESFSPDESYSKVYKECGGLFY